MCYDNKYLIANNFRDLTGIPSSMAALLSEMHNNSLRTSSEFVVFSSVASALAALKSRIMFEWSMLAAKLGPVLPKEVFNCSIIARGSVLPSVD